ncbi:hypothetical protein HBA54_27310 [Pelagibius litoralis]|uniref:Uncharacterized protein n=1 Tax=Pelagibius litoralis TaxID=374515 RepID=A0A967F3H0_9PROT|nr:hypothetical protein [Pelagibius litoralis]NIA72304.1 hypothetical protein [Pelagibius litoralis]
MTRTTFDRSIDIQKQAAYAAGRHAAHSDGPIAPCQCPVYLEMVDGMEFGEGAADLAREWLRGYRIFVLNKEID